MKPIQLLLLIACLPLTLYSQHNHSTQTRHPKNTVSKTILSEPGNDVFATIQEVIRKLEKRPGIDWSKVSIPDLRQHLLDMRDVAEHVKVTSSTPIDKGLRVTIQATTTRARDALTRVLEAHPKMLEQETGWQMRVSQKGKNRILSVTTENPGEVAKIRALGYFGLIAYGAHHQRHHWKIATGQHPHED